MAKSGRAHLEGHVLLIVLAHVLPPALDLLRLFFVHFGNFVSSVAERMQYFVQLRVDGLCVAMLGALNHQRHGPGCQCGHRVPFESFRLKNIPQGCVNKEYEKRQRAGNVNAEAG